MHRSVPPCHPAEGTEEKEDPGGHDRNDRDGGTQARARRADEDDERGGHGAITARLLWRPGLPAPGVRRHHLLQLPVAISRDALPMTPRNTSGTASCEAGSGSRRFRRAMEQETTAPRVAEIAKTSAIPNSAGTIASSCRGPSVISVDGSPCAIANAISAVRARAPASKNPASTERPRRRDKPGQRPQHEVRTRPRRPQPPHRACEAHQFVTPARPTAAPHSASITFAIRTPTAFLAARLAARPCAATHGAPSMRAWTRVRAPGPTTRARAGRRAGELARASLERGRLLWHAAVFPREDEQDEDEGQHLGALAGEDAEVGER